MKAEVVFALENAAWPALVVNRGGLIQQANRAAANTFPGVKESGGGSGANLWAPANALTWERFLEQLLEANPSSTVVHLLTQEGRSESFLAHISAYIRDGQKQFLFQLVTSQQSELSPESSPPEPRPTEKQQKPDVPAGDNGLIQKHRLDCALQLIRTVALDFNNALTSILGHTSLILSKLEPTHPWRNSLLEVEKSAEKAAEVASDLAAFSRQEKDARSQVDGNLNDLVRRAVELVQAPHGHRIEWTLELEPRLYTAAFEETKLQQAFIKILDNAVQAITGAGRITVRTRNQPLTEPLQDGHVRLNPGQYVCVAFEDTGCGIPADVLPRVFEPFFTTKTAPNHRGLGLAWVYGIVTNHGGGVAVSSQVGRGTSVRVYLPAQTRIIRDRGTGSDDLRGTETILMVDDEALLLTMGETILSSFGYRVLTANSGQKALEMFAQQQQKVDLVITDMVMPKMSGRELIEQLHRLAPGLKIICSSGYLRPSSPDEEEIYLQKPFTSLDLLRKVKQVLFSSDAS